MYCGLLFRSANVEAKRPMPKARARRRWVENLHSDLTNIWYCCHSLQSSGLLTFVTHQASCYIFHPVLLLHLLIVLLLQMHQWFWHLIIFCDLMIIDITDRFVKLYCELKLSCMFDMLIVIIPGYLLIVSQCDIIYLMNVNWWSITFSYFSCWHLHMLFERGKHFAGNLSVSDCVFC